MILIKGRFCKVVRFYVLTVDVLSSRSYYAGCLLYFLVILAMHNVHAVLPPRVDTLTRLDRNSLIEHYFHLGFDYSEILGFLLLCHGIQISLRQLK